MAYLLRMKWLVVPLLVSCLASCAENPGRIDAGGSGRQGPGNAPLEGPDADDVINDVHRDRARQHYEDRTGKRRYGQFN